METPIKMDDLGIPLVLETPMSCVFFDDVMICHVESGARYQPFSS